MSIKALKRLATASERMRDLPERLRTSWVAPGRGSGGGKASISFWMSVAENISAGVVGLVENMLSDKEASEWLVER